MPVAPIDTDQIVITASRAPIEDAHVAASVTVIDPDRVERIGEPLVPALLRLTPSVAITQSGSAGTVAEVRIRGAEANHTLLFIDGIRANDPARGEAPRFELLNADIASRIEVVRGPQSALWGSEAIGGVVAVTGAAGDRRTATAAAEAGSFGFVRASIGGSLPHVAGAVAWQSATGIDIFGGGDRDGYRNVAARGRAEHRLSDGFAAGAAGFLLGGRSEYDGPDPITFEQTHALVSKDRMIGGRAWLEAGRADQDWHGNVSVSRLGSRSLNFFEGDEINRTGGSRTTFSGQAERRSTTGPIEHLFVLGVDHERETFTASDTVYGGTTAQDRDRTHNALTAEWRATARRMTADLAVRRDSFNRFKDATTLRGSLLLELGHGFAVAGTYGEGIAQPTFFDLYGFSPGIFVGNATLTPESSRGHEASLRYRGSRFSAALTGYRQRLRDEIVDTFDFGTGLFSTANRNERSRRSGIEAEAGWSVGEWLRVTGAYAYLRATQPTFDGSAQMEELRRPRHSGSVAADGRRGRFAYAATLALTGTRRDVNEQPPYQIVRLDSYWLAGGRLSYRLRPGVELFARGANLLGEHYQDVFRYRTEGRSLYAGIRLGARP